MPEEHSSNEVSQNRAVSVIVDGIVSFLGHVPASIKRNVVKAFGHLMKVPNAHIEGRAAEIKAEYDARIKLTAATGNALAKSIQVDSPLAAIAATTHASKILRQQLNAAKVLQYATEEIEGSNFVTEQENDTLISEDWLNAFESEAINMSSEQMQRLFGKILAGEIFKPATFSIRTVKIIAQLDNEAAKLFRKFCSMTCSIGFKDHLVDSRVLSLGGSAGSNVLINYGLSFMKLTMLAEYGLVNTDFATSAPYSNTIINEAGSVVLPVKYINKYFGFVPVAPKKPVDYSQFMMSGVQLTSAGRELLSIVDIEEDRSYTDALINYLNEQGLQFIEIAKEPHFL